MAEPVTIDFPETDPQASVLAGRELSMQAPPELLRLAEGIQFAFLEKLNARVTDMLSVPAHAFSEGIEQSPLSRLRPEGQANVLDIPLRLSPFDGYGFLSISTELLFKVLDIVLVSPPGVNSERHSELTDLEWRLLNNFVEMLAGSVRELWTPEFVLSFSPDLAASGNAFASVPDTQMLVFRSMLVIDGVEGRLDLAMPSFLLRIRVTTPPGLSVLAQPDNIDAALSRSLVDVEAVLSNLRIRVADLLELAPGQILLGDSAGEGAFECTLNRKSHFRGELVACTTRYGFQLTSPLPTAQTLSPADR